MHTNLFDSFQRIATRMRAVWPDVAFDLVNLPHAEKLSLRDLATLMLFAPGEPVGRPAVELLVGVNDADAVLGALEGQGLIVKEARGFVLADQGRAFLDQVVDGRARAVSRIVGALPPDMQDQVVQSAEAIANIAERAEALTRVQGQQPQAGQQPSQPQAGQQPQGQAVGGKKVPEPTG